MVNRFLFKDRDGRTPLPEEFRKDLIPQDVVTAGDLDSYEEQNIVDGLVWLEDYRGECIDWMFWEKLHKKLFGKVWRWAGQIRRNELENDEFNHPGQIRENLKRLEGDLKYWLENNSFGDPREAIARFPERFLTIHPFANGNGRTSRILAEFICKREAVPIPTWGAALRGDVGNHRGNYIAAIVKARRDGDFGDLIEFMYSSADSSMKSERDEP